MLCEISFCTSSLKLECLSIVRRTPFYMTAGVQILRMHRTSALHVINQHPRVYSLAFLERHTLLLERSTRILFSEFRSMWHNPPSRSASRAVLVRATDVLLCVLCAMALWGTSLSASRDCRMLHGAALRPAVWFKADDMLFSFSICFPSGYFAKRWICTCCTNTPTSFPFPLQCGTSCPGMTSGL